MCRIKPIQVQPVIKVKEQSSEEKLKAILRQDAKSHIGRLAQPVWKQN